MKKYAVIIIASLMCLLSNGQGFEGALKISYKDEAGKMNTSDVFIKGDKYYIKKGQGGNEKYNAYLLDTKTHTLSCISDKTPKTIIAFNADKVFNLYEKNKIKQGYKVHETLNYQSVSNTKSISGINAAEKKVADDTLTFDIYTADIKVDFHSLIPVLRIVGLWNRLEDGNNAILEGRATNKVTTKESTVSIIPTKSTISDKLFDLPKEYQTVDLNKFLNEQANNPKVGDLLKALSGL